MASRSSLLAIALATLAIAALPPLQQAAAVPGDPEPTFGNNGIAEIAVPGTFASTQGLLVLPGGKLVLFGRAVTASLAGLETSDFAVARLNADATRDDRFASDGVATVDFGGADMATAAALQPDGKLVVVGVAFTAGFPPPPAVDYTRPPSEPTWPRIGVARFNPDGRLDQTFGDGGKRTFLFGEASFGDAVVLLPDGRILIGGSTASREGFFGPTPIDFLLVRLQANGDLDAAFGNGGAVVQDLYGGSDSINALALQPDGKVLAAGEAAAIVLGSYGATRSVESFGAVRFNPDGTLDRGFAGNGKLVPRMRTDVSLYPQEKALATELLPDGRILLIGYSSFNTAIARLLPDGSFDPSFGSGGKVLQRVGGGNWRRSAALAPDGRLIVASVDTLTSFNPDGSVDHGFSGTGTDRVTLRSGLSAAGVEVVDGRVLTAVTVSRKNEQLLGVAAYPLAASGALEGAGCVIRGRLKELRDRLPDRVGTCIEEERLNPETGFVEQLTTKGVLGSTPGGLFPRFDNGTTVWILGPLGLESRPSTAPPTTWETMRPEPTPPAPPAEPSASMEGQGEPILSDALTAPGALRVSRCPTGRNDSSFSPEGWQLRVTGPCLDGSTISQIADKVRGLAFVDGALRFEFRSLAGPDRSEIQLTFRFVLEASRAHYVLSIRPGRRETVLWRFGSPSKPLVSERKLPESFQPEGWNELGLRLRGSEIEILVNSVPVIGVSDAAASDTEVGIGLVRAGSVEDDQPVSVLFRNLRVANHPDTPAERRSTYTIPPAKVLGISFTTIRDGNRFEENDIPALPAGTPTVFGYYAWQDVVPPHKVRGYFVREGQVVGPTGDPFTPRFSEGFGWIKLEPPEGLTRGTYSFVVELNGTEVMRRELLVE